jgi:chorismate-pyruvate lyase
MSKLLGALAVSSLLLGSAAPGSAAAWPADFTGRLEALALLQTLNSDLLSHDSATLTLERWCGEHGLADPAKVVAHRQTEIDKPVSPEQRRLLGVGPEEPVRYRRVQLVCGARVLSEADNWYVPSRLTPEMNRALDTSDVAFGRAVQSLHFQRHTLSAEALWSPLPKGWESQPVVELPREARLTIPEHVLQHRAILTLPDGTPFSEVVETYTSQVLAFRPPEAAAR